MNDKRMYVIPTNRLCDSVLKSLFYEIRDVQEKYDENFKVVLLDGASKKDFIANNEALINLNGIIKDCDIYHIPQNSFDNISKNIINNIDGKDNNLLTELLTGDKFSYGMAANRTFLIANMLECNYIHRRDSDVHVQRKNGMNICPLEVEVKCLGKKVGDIHKIKEKDVPYKLDKKIYMVGSSYIGNWGIDYEDLQDNLDILIKLFKLSKPNMSDLELKDYIYSKYIYGSKEEYKEDYMSFAESTNIDLGNYSICNIFNYLPISPAVATSGTDYFYHGILDSLCMPKLYHNRRVIHEYSNTRYSDISINTYHLSKSMSRCNKLYSSLIYKKIRDNVDITGINNKDAKKIAEILFSVCQESLVKEQKEVLNSLINIYKETKIEKYIKAANYISENQKTIIQKSPKDIYNHGVLINEWHSIIENFKGKKKLIEKFKL